MKSESFDVLVIGGGPAGLMAAGRAAECGAHVLLLEKNPAAGRKLLMTGNGRCNLTQAEEDIRHLIKQYKNGSFLFSAYHRFGPKQVVEFFESRGIRTKVEENQRVFPVSDKASDVLACLLRYLKSGQVEIRYGSEVKKLKRSGDGMVCVLSTGEEIASSNLVLSTGGKSYPSTGSTGDGWAWLRSLGHTIIDPKPALVPLKTKESWIAGLKGLALEKVSLKVIQDKKVIAKTTGDLLFTHFGVSGPAVFTISREAVAALDDGRVMIEIDALPDQTSEQVETALSAKCRIQPAKAIKHTLAMLIPARLSDVLLQMSKIDPLKPSGQITKGERHALVVRLKGLELTVLGSLGFEAAMVTSGGVDIKEIDPKTMQSKLIPHLFLAGEVIDVDGPTGGYNLQLCWSTGYAAGEAAALDVKATKDVE